jgi:hypothetical protein
MSYGWAEPLLFRQARDSGSRRRRTAQLSEAVVTARASEAAAVAPIHLGIQGSDVIGSAAPAQHRPIQRLTKSKCADARVPR